MKSTKMSVLGTAAAVLIIIFGGYRVAYAIQPEPAVMCNEGVILEPLGLNYGEHVENCAIDTLIDVDTFSFAGAAGDKVRIKIRTSNSVQANVDVFDPDGIIISGTAQCTALPACTVELTLDLTKNGTHTIAMDELGLNATGDYQIQIDRVPPAGGGVALAYNVTESDTVDREVDIDFFAFSGANGSQVRITVGIPVGSDLIPKIEVWDPNNVEIEDTFCTASCDVDVALAEDGAHLIGLSGRLGTNFGAYDVRVTCLTADCPAVLPAVAVCDATMSQTSYVDGETVTAASWRIANLGAADLPVEIKAWVGTPLAAPETISLLSLGADGSLVLPGGFDADLGPVDLFGVVSGLPRGTWSFNCRVLNPTTGRQMALDLNPFELE